MEKYKEAFKSIYYSLPEKAPNKRKVALKMYVRQTENCHYCKEYIDMKNRTCDHVIPASEGGGWCIGNLVMACASCNSERGNIDYNEFKERICVHTNIS